ncbi:MAG: uroporphyrinogen-III C-methyltransferase [Xanthomonadales bacterium]|nr:uroporphyrinogen-III C-methyltransferase [Xanthomonadales bacterium]
MSTADTPPAPDGAHPVPPATPSATPPGGARRAPAQRSGGTLGLALLLALLAILGAGYVGWRQWQSAGSDKAEAASLMALQQRIAAVENSLQASDRERADIARQLAHVAQQDQDLGAQLPALDQRMRSLEAAVATLGERTRSGREPMLLDETESLLRMGMERYRLFHDAQGAQRAYALAEDTLEGVDDGSFSTVLQAIRAERAALLGSHPQGDTQMLAQLENLRGSVPTMPLAPLEPSDHPQVGVWARIGRVLGGLIHVQRDNGGPLALQDARFARELLALDLAQAQAALLAHDDTACHAALQRAAASVDGQFDTTAPAVRQAQAQLQQLQAAVVGAPVRLGAALSELRNLRAVHALRPASAGSAAGAPPAVSAATAGRRGAARPDGSRA